jgi:hypothetical protein
MKALKILIVLGDTVFAAANGLAGVALVSYAAVRIMTQLNVVSVLLALACSVVGIFSLNRANFLVDQVRSRVRWLRQGSRPEDPQ